MTASLVPLSIPQTITIYRQKYPDGLICIECGSLLATRRESYAKSTLTEADRCSYVCFECRLDLAEAERVHEGRVEKAKQEDVLKEADKLHEDGSTWVELAKKYGWLDKSTGLPSGDRIKMAVRRWKERQESQGNNGTK